ncbi:hypothetical protein FA13DRAFT_1744633 [Coprinellus micaceus]|uniref:F-box domain-containing protein n=1 Tax=Coprinellus micaceus TaxID=71717 RepID=A0A4Y7SCN5_COPMI|nr:hypothetical protein FA13DRAFT_1744633 [Coprinellus micaceus]
MTPAEAAHSDVAIDTFLHWSQNLDNVQHMVEAWTHRSMTCPIRLSLTSGERNASLLSRSTLRAARERFEAFVDILCASARRWAHVDFKLTFDPMTEDAVALFNLPSSEYEAILSAKVKLVDNSRSSSPVVETWVSNLASSRMFSAPFLTTVSFPGLWGDFAAARSLSTIPLYAFVTTLDFMGPAIGINNDVGSFRARRIQDVSAVLEVLRSFPLLVDCKICVRDFEAIRVPGTPVSLPHLKSMTLVGSTVCKGFAPSVHLPQLAVLAFEDYVVLNRPIDEWSNGVIEFLRIHGSHLSEVAFLPQVIPPSSILTCLQSIPNVLKLTISSGMTRSSIYRGVDIAWIKALQTPSLCPQLEVLEVKGAQNSQLDGSMEKAVVDMIISRRAGGSNVSPGSGAERETSLREIVVDFTDPQKVDMMKELRAHHPDVSDMDLKTAYSLLGCS